MFNTVSLYGVLGEVDSSNPLFRKIRVERHAKNNSGLMLEDNIDIMYWTKKEKGLLYTMKEGSVITLSGRLEVYEGKVIVVVEEFSYLGMKG